MRLCPSDGKPCPDDLCHGGGCIKTGEEMDEVCDICEGIICHEIPECGTCTCDDDFDDFDDFSEEQ